ncbi:MarR family winged helix-turn-helix transcriptional regulator [Neobacillus mesonae]|uniref:MarR family transcriptional regulator n=1 Tax=Neobacillus mesonae TaxID=1193713 RepID=A0A3Q9QU92_9BACI|nr:MarR family transcriptional regulator [Neobacillus mesonae]AZU61708.1 MarR family transcriptional regulator [Neobacillus mesonae]MED4205232.1 MarR family transcriptional regulator [Neobacillus mesonae]
MDNSLEMIELEMAILIRRITSATGNKKIGKLDRSAYLILHQIATNGAAGVKMLAGEFQLDISTVSRQAAALEHKGYLYKIPDPTDGRAYHFQITELGLKELKEDKQARMERVAEVTKDWPEEEREIFGKLLRKFNHAAISI